MHIATIWEALSDAFEAHAFHTHGATVRTWREFDVRAARLASAFLEAGLQPGAKIGLFMHNRPEYLEAQFAAFKMRAVPINVNYRYRAEELRYLLDNADVEALVYQQSFAEDVERVRGSLPKLRLRIEVSGDAPALHGALAFQDAIARFPAMARIPRPEDDVYIIYTGGTTGMPKGVMYPQGQLCRTFVRPFEALGYKRPSTPAEVVDSARRIAEHGLSPVSLICCPLMHGTGMWLGAIMPSFQGGRLVTLPGASFDADEAWRAVARERATSVSIVGDAFARPMARALETAAAAGAPYDITSLRRIVSSGVMWSREVKESLLRHHDVELNDVVGSSEGGVGGSRMTRADSAHTAEFTLNEDVTVLKEDGTPVTPGSEEIGLIATAFNLPLGYYKDPEATARAFRVVNGRRYSFPGDYAKVNADGSIVLLGRGSNCINTGGEKVFPEEVEEAVKQHPAVEDCLVVGVPDQRFGQRVVAIVALAPGARAGADEIVARVRARLSSYKAPRGVYFADAIKRFSNAKADYAWAKDYALAANANASDIP
jgi:3-oxocholest-4-en-26-oate---CoA ligase